MGRLYDRFGAALIMPPLFLLAICALFLMAVAESSAILWLAGILFGIGFGNYQSVQVGKRQVHGMTMSGKADFASAPSKDVFMELMADSAKAV